MKRNKYLFVLLLLVSILVVAYGSIFVYRKIENNAAIADDDFVIMTSCNPINIATRNIAKDIDGVKVVNLSQPSTGCLHDYALTPQDLKSLANADVLVVNGSGMEGYLDDVISAYPDLPIISSTEYSTFLGDDADAINELLEENSHSWLSMTAYTYQIMAIEAGLSELDAEHSDVYSKNAEEYIANVSDELSAAKDAICALLSGEDIVLLHEAYEYMALDFGANVAAVMDLDEERQVSAGEVADFISIIKDNDIKIVFAEIDYGSQMGDMIEEQTDARVVYLQTLIHGRYGAGDYEKYMLDNYNLILEALEY